MSQELDPSILDRETSSRCLTKVAPFLRGSRLKFLFWRKLAARARKSDHSRARVSSSFTRIVNTPYQVDNDAAARALRIGATRLSLISRLEELVNVINEFLKAILIQQIQPIDGSLGFNAIGLAGMNQDLLTIRLHGCVSNRPLTPSAARRLLCGAIWANLTAVSHRWTRLGT